jgi:Domain of unknown function (DUF4153)
MRLPSVAAAIRRAGEAAARFPLALAAAFVATGGLITAIEASPHDWVAPLVVTAVLGVPLFTATSVAAERLGLRQTVRWTIEPALLVGLVLLYRSALSWPDPLLFLRFAQLLVAAHLLVAVLPYARPGSVAGFWQYNRSLLLRFLIGAVYAVVLWGGLAIALVAIERLLGIHVRRELYPDLLVILAFTVHPWFVLAGVPDDFARLDTVDDYPLGLKVFAQFVLIPLVSVYLVILTIYLGRVIITRTWPSGWIGWLVSSVSTAGVLALLLVHPARDRADSRWVNGYGRWFFVALLPSLGMLLVAAAKRIGQYGVTEPRYFLVVLGLWMVGLAIYYGITASRNIKVIPGSLAVVALLSSIGPWSAFSVPTRSQVHRFQAILASTRTGGSGGGASTDDQSEASAVLRYLRETHGVPALARATGLDRDSLVAWGGGGSTRRVGPDADRTALERLGIGYVAPGSALAGLLWVGSPEPGAVDVAGFELLYPVDLAAGGRRPFGRDSLSLQADTAFRTVTVRRGADSIAAFEVGRVVDSLVRFGAPSGRGDGQLAGPIVVDAAGADFVFRLVFQAASGERRPAGARLTSASGVVLIRRRNAEPGR